jgi:epoxyqueuosine reductase
MVSYRGALALNHPIDLPDHRGCALRHLFRAMPTACPVGALSGAGYDAASCHAFSTPAPATDCMNHGCAVRRACPFSQSYGRLPEQSAYHMRQFHP